MGERPTQSRKRGQGGNSPPCGVKGRSSLVGFGATPQLLLVKPTQKENSTRCRQRSVPASNFAHPQMRPPTCSTHPSHIVAPNGRDRVSVISYYIDTFEMQGFRHCGSDAGFASRPLDPFDVHSPCFLFFPAACLFLRQADSHRWTQWGIGAVAAAVGILPACAFRRIPANFLPLNQPASCRPPLGLRTAKSPLFIGKILSNHLSNVSEYDKILSGRNQLRQVRVVHEKGDFFDDS